MPSPENTLHKPADASLRQHSRDVLQGSAAAAFAKVGTTAIGFMFNLALARAIGAEQTGILFIALALATVAGILSRLGLDKAVLKYASQHASLHEWGAVKAVYLRAIKAVALGSVCFVVVLYLGSSWLAETVFGKPDLTSSLLYMSLAVLPLSLVNLHAQFLKSIKYIGTGLFLQNASISGICLVGLLLLPGFDSAAPVAGLYLVAAVLASLFIVILWLRLAGLTKVETDAEFESGAMSRSSSSLYVVSIMNQIVLPWGAIILLGVWGTEEEAGQFGIARRLAMLINFAYLAVESITGPKFAALFAAGDMVAVRHVARRATLLMALVAAPLAGLFIVAPDWVMTWFGDDFRAGAAPLVVLAAGQLFNALTGSVANLLIMSGHEKSFRNVTIVAGTLNVLLCVILIPRYGALGAAWSTAAAVALVNLVSLIMVWRKLGFLPFPTLPGSATR